MSTRKYASKENQAKHDELESKLYKTFTTVEEKLHESIDYGEVLKHHSYKKARAQWSVIRNQCPECGSDDSTVVDYDPMWHDGDVVCNRCNTYIRAWDAG